MKSIHHFKMLLARSRARQGISSPHQTSTPPSFNAREQIAKAEEIQALVDRRENYRKTQVSGDSNKHSHEYSHHENELVTTEHEPRFLGIGTGGRDDFIMDEATPNVVADSPTNVDFNVYDAAYEAEVERIQTSPTRRGTKVFLTRFVAEMKEKRRIKGDAGHGDDGVDGDGAATPKAGPKAEDTGGLGIAKLAQRVSEVLGVGGAKE